MSALSINKCFQGRRFKTAAYKNYEKELWFLLPANFKIPPFGNLSAHFIFGLSSKNADLDNCVKAFLDVLSKKYEFNDKRIYCMLLEKKLVKKGEEFISFFLSIL